MTITNQEPKIFLPEEWMGKDSEDRKPLNRAVRCLEHLIQDNYAGRAVNVIEIGPISNIDDLHHVAPISVLYERNPSLNCLSVGLEKVTEEQRKKTLGGVRYMYRLIASPGKDDSEVLLRELGGRPQIVYGQHVFENSSSSPRSLPFGPYKPFEGSAKLLAEGGFIVADNYGGEMAQIGIHRHCENSSKMKHVFSYMYGDNEGIYVFQKSNNTRELHIKGEK